MTLNSVGPIRLLALILSTVLTWSSPGVAAIRTVTALGDTTPGGTPGQLRFEITAAASGDTIVIPAGTITLTGAAGEDANASGDLDITKSLIIQGAGAGVTIIDGGGIDRVFHIQFDTTLVISGVTVRTGSASVVGDVVGGGIMNFGTLTLNNTIVANNTANAGGGIMNFGTLTLNNTSVTGNTAANLGFTNADGAGIVNQGGTLTITNSTISGNQGGTAFISRGGGIRNVGGILVLRNSTVSGNIANIGGGIDNQNGTATLINSTITGNSANGRGGVSHFTFSGSDTVTVMNTIVANNSPENCGGNSLTAAGHNLDSGTTCGFTAPGDLNSTDPLLGPLAHNGGPTQTHALLLGSPAIDAVTSGCPPPATDQRGVARPQGAACDIGAYEGASGSVATLTNISTRGLVQTGDNVMIGGFIIGGDTPKRVLVRAIGPSLAAFGVPGVLADPTLQLFSGPTAIAENNDWQTPLPLCGPACGTAADITATGLAPGAPLEAALLITLDPGAYTAIVSGVGGTTGVGLVEVFEVP